jgi:hypothetical protein
MPSVRVVVALALTSLAAACARRADPPARVTSAVTLAPFIGPESAIDSPVYGDREGDQRSPFIAPGGPGALIAWQDESNGQGNVSDERVFAARVDAAGAPLDRMPLPVAPLRTSPVAVETPAAAWNGDVALVTWLEYTGDGAEVHAARIGRDGARMDLGGIDVALGPTTRTSLHVLPADGGFVVTWLEPFTTARIARVGADGTVTPKGGAAISLPDSLKGTILADAARVDGGYLLLFGEVSLEVMKVDAAGNVLAPLGPRGDNGASPGAFFSLTSNGATALALWSESSTVNADPPWTVYGRRVSAAGAWIDAAPFVVRSAGPAQAGLVGAVWTGTSFLCYWNEYKTRVTLSMRRFGADGVAMDATPIVPTSLAGVPLGSTQLAWTGTHPVVAMVGVRDIIEGGSSQQDWPDGIRTRALDANLQPVGADAVLVSTAPNAQIAPRAIASPGAAQVVWQDDRNNSDRTIYGWENWDVYGARVAVVDGKLTQAVAPLIATSGIDRLPGVGWDGTQFAVTALVGDGAHAAVGTLVVVPAAGGPPGPSVALASPVSGSSLIWNGTNYLLVRDGSPASAWRMTPAGTILDATARPIYAPVPPGYIDTESSDYSGVAMGGAWLIVFEGAIIDQPFGKPEVDQIEGVVIAADGTKSAPVVLSTGPTARVTPAIATDGTGALVVWIDAGTADGGVGTTRVMGARFDGAFARRDAAEIAIAEAAPGDILGEPTVAWTGAAYVALWTRTTGSAVSLVSCLLGADLHCQPGTQTSTTTGAAATVPRAADVGPVAVDNHVSVQGISDTSLLWTDAGGVLFYRRHDTTVNVDRDRVFARPVIVGAAPPPAFDAGTETGGSDGSATDAGDDRGRAGGTAGQGGAAGGGAGSAGVPATGASGSAGSSAGRGGSGGPAPKASGCACDLTANGSIVEANFALLSMAVALLFARRNRDRPRRQTSNGREGTCAEQDRKSGSGF